MIIIGLTGISGSGKSYVCDVFAEYNIPTVDADKTVHSIYVNNKDCICEIKAAFGDRVISDDGTVNRSNLREIVFSDREQLAKLNLIVHKYTLSDIDRQINDYQNNGYSAVIVDAPQLFESGYDKKCDVIISVICDTNLRVDRICARDGITKDAAYARISNQKSDEFFINNSDYLIYNNGKDVKIQVESILEKLELK